MSYIAFNDWDSQVWSYTPFIFPLQSLYWGVNLSYVISPFNALNVPVIYEKRRLKLIKNVLSNLFVQTSGPVYINSKLIKLSETKLQGLALILYILVYQLDQQYIFIYSGISIRPAVYIYIFWYTIRPTVYIYIFWYTIRPTVYIYIFWYTTKPTVYIYIFWYTIRPTEYISIFWYIN